VDGTRAPGGGTAPARVEVIRPRHPDELLARLCAAHDGAGRVTDRLRAAIREIPDFPRQGVLFRDITPLLRDPAAFHDAIDLLTSAYRDGRVDAVVGVESRGFIIGGALAYALGAGFVPARKHGKLPGRTVSVVYSLEYGEAVLELHADAIKPGQRVLVVDDLIATGGTARAAVSLVEQLGGQVVGVAFVIELAELKGMDRLAPHRAMALITF